MEQLKPGFNFLSYTLNECIGKGKFGSLWSATNKATDQTVTIKFENPTISKSILTHESEILKELSSKPCKYFPEYYGNGTENGLNYLIFEKVGKNIRTYRKSNYEKMMPIRNACILGIEMLKAIQNLHERGFVHRDLKPSNFVFRGNEEHMELFLIGYGLAKRWCSPEGEIYPPRENVGFRGPLRYASINSHKGHDLGRCDDLLSIFYILDELCTYPLFWEEIKNKDEVYRSKEMFDQKHINWSYFPSEYKEFYNEIKSLNFDDEPDYDYFMNLLDSIIIDQMTIDEYFQGKILPQSNYFLDEIGLPSIPSESSSTIEGSLSETISDHSIKEKSQNESEDKVEGGCCFLS